MSSPNKIHVERFNDNAYKFNVSIYDASGNYIQLNAGTIQNLTIEDSIFIPFTVGTATVFNVNGVLQSSSKPQGNSLDFSGNNHDILAIDIMPAVSQQGLEADCNNEDLTKIFNLNTAYCINELQDADEQGSPYRNVMNFRDCYHQLMLENSAQFNSVDVLASQNKLVGNPDVLNNSQRSVEVGELIKYLLRKTFDTDDIIDKNENNEELFDKGFGKMMFSSQYNSNAFQDMMHLNSLQLSEQKKDPCILKLNRYTKKFSNIALSKYFELQKTEPETYVMESFIVSDGQPGKGEQKPPAGRGLDGACNIAEYKLTPINGNEFTRKITNAIYNATASADKNHYIGVKQNNLKNTFEEYKELYVKPFESIAPGAVPSIDFDQFLNQNTLRPKIVNTNMPIKFETLPRNSMFLDLIVSGGDNIVFKVLGSTHRVSGKFFDITSISQISDNNLAKRLLGRWFAVKVTHTFTGTKYYNIIEAVKTYTAPTDQ